MFDIYDSIVGICGEVPEITPQSDSSILVQVETPDQATLREKLMIINNKLFFVNPTKP